MEWLDGNAAAVEAALATAAANTAGTGKLGLCIVGACFQHCCFLCIAPSAHHPFACTLPSWEVKKSRASRHYNSHDGLCCHYSHPVSNKKLIAPRAALNLLGAFVSGKHMQPTSFVLLVLDLARSF